jgi:hypothetical protein
MARHVEIFERFGPIMERAEAQARALKRMA